MFYVYKITNNINNKVYIGETNNPNIRWKRHLSTARNKKSKAYSLIHKSINKYGKENFSFEILEQFKTEQEALDREIELVAIYKSNNDQYGMNLTKGGEGISGFELTKEHKEKISKSLKGRTVSEETRKLKSQALKGKPLTEETKKKLSQARLGKFTGKDNPFYGKNHTEENKKRISLAHIGKDFKTEDGKKRQKLAISGEKNHFAVLNDELVKKLREEYKNNISIYKLAKNFNLDYTTVRRVVRYITWKHVK